MAVKAGVEAQAIRMAATVVAEVKVVGGVTGLIWVGSSASLSSRGSSCGGKAFNSADSSGATMLVTSQRKIGSA